MQSLTSESVPEDFAGIPAAVLLITLPGCVPCRSLKPVLEQLDGELPDVAFYVADASECFTLAQSYQLSSAPTSIFLRHGQEIARFLGYRPIATWRERLTAFDN